MPSDDIFSQLLSSHVDPNIAGWNQMLFQDLVRPPSYLDKLSGVGNFNVRDPFVTNLFLQYLKGPIPMQDDPVAQIQQYLGM